MANTKQIIITLFSEQTICLGDDSISEIREGFYPSRVKSKILATIRDFCSDNSGDNLVGFLPVSKESNDRMKHFPIPSQKDYTQDHYGNLALYLSPEVPCNVVTNLLKREIDGNLNCRADLISDGNVIVISDDCSDWTELEDCLEKAGAKSIKCITIFNN